MDEVEKLYEKILDNEDWEMEDLDKLLELVRTEAIRVGNCIPKDCLESVIIPLVILLDWMG